MWIGLLAALGLGGLVSAILYGVAREESRDRPPSPLPSLMPRSDGVAVADIRQEKIISLLWRGARFGYSSDLEKLEKEINYVPNELLAYFVAASSQVLEAVKKDDQFRYDFEHAFDEEKLKDSNGLTFKQQQGIVDGALGIAGAAVNAIPIAGQVISAVIAIVIMIRQFVLNNLSDANRKASENEKIFKEQEGSDCLLGLRLEKWPNPSKKQLEREIAADIVASRLPRPVSGYRFEFCPTIEKFREVASRMRLYSKEAIDAAYGFSGSIRSGATEIPVNAFDIQQYSTGYTVGYNGGTPPATPSYWFGMGYQDGASKLDPVVNSQVQNWAEQRIEAIGKD